jgi:hypothetical protein
MTGLDPSGKRALFEAPVSAPPEQLLPQGSRDGRDAMFSVGPRLPGTVVVDCSSCHGRARIPITDFGTRMLTGSWFMPLRKHDYWLRCPVCNHRTWCNVSWRR